MKHTNLQKNQETLRKKFINQGVKMVAPETVYFFKDTKIGRNVTIEPYVVIDPEFYRPCEVDWLLGHTGKAREKLGWRPKVSFQELVQRMVRSDIDAARKEKLERPSLQELEETG